MAEEKNYLSEDAMGFGAASKAPAYLSEGDMGFAPPKGGTASDLGKSLKAGVQRLPGMATGLADLPFALAAGARPFTKAADALGEATGFQPGKWVDETQFSQGYEDSKKAVDAAWKDGKASDIAGAYLSNPGYTANQVVESLPSMFAGGFGAKALMGAGRVAGVAADAAAGTAARAATPGLVARAVGEKWAAPVAGGIGEGAVTAGQQMAGYQGDDQQKGAVAALGAGVGTGLIGGATGYLANSKGFNTVETLMANWGRRGAGADAPASLKKRVLGGMVSEGVLQELPQSAQEQMWSNFADGKPLMEGVARAGTEGALAGAVMGAGANLRGPGAQPTNDTPPAADPATNPAAQGTPPGAPPGDAPNAPPAPAPQLGYSPLAGTPTVFPDGSVALGSEAELAHRYAPQPVKPSEEMGLNPAAGPLSAAAASAVDSGAYMPPADQAPPPAPEPDPVVLQNRDRTSAASIAQMQEIAANPDYLRVGPSRDMTSGAPIVFGDLPQAALLGRMETVVDGNGERMGTQYAVVESESLIPSNNADGTTVAEYASGAPGKLRSVAGNGRTAGLQAAYQLGTTQRYRQELEADAAAIGVDAQALAAMQRPVLVRLMQGEDVTRDMGDRTNITATQKLSPLEQAGNDARRLDVRTLAFDEGGSPTADSIKGFVSAMPVSERGDMLNPDGTPTRQAVDRLMAATFKQAYESDELVQLYAQATDPDARAVMAAAADASGVLSNLKGAGEFDVRAAVADAAKMAVNAARQGVKLADVLKNSDIDISPEAYPVAEFLAQNIRSPKAMAEGLRRWGQLALEQARIAEENTRQGSLLGPRPTLSRAEIFARMGNEANPTGQGIAPAPAKAAPVQADMAQQPQELPAQPQELPPELPPEQPQAAQPQAATEATGRHSTWRKNAIQAGRVARELGLEPQGKSLPQIVAEIDAYDAAQNKPAAAGEKLKLNIFGLPDGIDFLPGTQAVPASSLKAGDWIVIDSAINSVKGVKPISSQRLELDLLGADGRYAIEVSPSTTVQRKLTSADGAAAPESALDGMLEGLDAIKSGMAKTGPAADAPAAKPASLKEGIAQARARKNAEAKPAQLPAGTAAEATESVADNPAQDEAAGESSALSAKQQWEQRKAKEAQQAEADNLASEKYNAYVVEQEHQAERRRLEGDNIIQQANGKPFKNESSAQTKLDAFDLAATHSIAPVQGGFVLRHKSVGRESYMQARAAVLADMGIGENADGEIDATESQWAEIERRIAQRLGQNPTASAQPESLELTAPTPAGIKAQQERAEAAAKADAAAKRADAAAAQADDDRKRIAAASVAAADSFELGQDPLDSLTGQKDVFADAPAQPEVKKAEVPKLPPTDIRIGDKVVVDGEAYTVTGPMKDGKKVVGIVASREDDANPYRAHQVFLRDDEAIAARIAAQQNMLQSGDQSLLLDAPVSTAPVQQAQAATEKVVPTNLKEGIAAAQAKRKPQDDKQALQDAMKSAGWAAELDGAENLAWRKKEQSQPYQAHLLYHNKAVMVVTALRGGRQKELATINVSDQSVAADAANKAVADDFAKFGTDVRYKQSKTPALAPRTMLNRGPQAVGGWVVVEDSDNKNHPGFSSEKSAKIAIAKNPDWRQRDAAILPFDYNDGSLTSAYAETRTRYAVVVRAETAMPATQPAVDAEASAKAAEQIRRADMSHNTTARLAAAYRGEAYRGTKEDYATLRSALEATASNANSPDSDLARDVLGRFDESIANLQARKEQNQPATPAATAQVATETAADKPAAKRKLPPKLAAKAAEVESQRAAYFAPGNVVTSYTGHDRVVAYTPADAQGNWSVTVQPVEQQGDKWVDVLSSKPRTHSTQPDARALKAGPLVAAKANQPATTDTPAQAAIESRAKDGVPASSLKIVHATQVDTPAQGVLNNAQARKEQAFQHLKTVRQQVKGGTANRLQLLKAESAHKEAVREVDAARAQIEADANKQGLTTVRAQKAGPVVVAKAQQRPATEAAIFDSALLRAKAAGVIGVRAGMSNEALAKKVKAHLAGERAARHIAAGKKSGLPQYQGVSEDDARVFAGLIDANPYALDSTGATWALGARGMGDMRQFVSGGLLENGDARYKHALTGVGKEIARRIASKPAGDASIEKMLTEIELASASSAAPPTQQQDAPKFSRAAANFAANPTDRPGTAQDKAVMQAIADGKSARDVLRLIAGQSKYPFRRQVARLLLKSGITPTLQFGHIGKTEKGNPIHGQYRSKTDTIAIAGTAERAAEHIFLHEAMHAATMRALDKPGIASLQLRKLFQHVQKQQGAGKFYGTTSVDEFVAEVFTNPDFQAALRKMTAPPGGTLKSAWDSFVRILRGILNLPNDSTNALSQALELGVAAMRDDMVLRKQGGKNAGRDANFGFDSRAADIQSSMGTLTPEQRATYEKVAGFQKVPTLKERMDSLKANLGLRLKQALVDQFAPIRDVSQRAYMLARMSKAGDAVIEALLYYGKPFMNDGVMDVKIGSGGFASVLASLKGEHDRFFMWVAAQRAERIRDERAAADAAMAGLNAQMIDLRRTMKTSTGKDYSDAATELRELESQHAKLDKTARELLFDENDITAFKSLNTGKMQDGTVRLPVYAAALRELNDYNEAALKTAMESGLIDKDTFELMKGQPYVPFYRLMENEGAMGGAKLSAGLTNQKAWEKLKGSDRQLNADLLQNVMQNWSHLYAASARNRAAVSTMAAAYRMGVATRANAATKGAVKISRKGVAEYWTVEDPYLLEAISAINYQASPLMKPLAKAKSLLTFGVTINPTFKIRNLIRDSLSAISQSELGYNPLKNVKSGWKLTASDSQIYASMLASGGVIKFGSQENNDRLRAKVAKLGGVLLDQNGLQKFQGQLKELYDVYAEFGDRTENVNRVALYDQLVKNGKSHAEASFMARDLMDFSMGGSHPLVRFLTQTVPFLNARLQGLYKLGRAANEDPRKFATMAMAVSVASVGLMALFGDDDDWKKREDWDRDAYWWFKVGETAFRIPKPFELGAIGTIAERTFELGFDDEMTGKRFMQRMSHMAAQTFALDPIPQAFKPLLDVYANKDSFTKRAIESQADQRLRPQDRYNERTSEVARMLGSLGLPEPSQLIKGNYAALSPKQIDHLIRGYFSWLGVTVATVSDFALRPMMDRGERPDMRLKDVFVAGNFIESLPTGSSRYVSQLYEQSRSVEQAFASYREAIKTGDMDGAAQIKEASIDKLRNRVAYANATKQLSEINAQAKRIEANTKLDGEAKRERLTELEHARDRIARSAAAAHEPI